MKYSPEHYEKRLAPMDIQVKRKISIQTILLSFVIVSAIFIALEIIFRAMSSLRSG